MPHYRSNFYATVVFLCLTSASTIILTPCCLNAETIDLVQTVKTRMTDTTVNQFKTSAVISIRKNGDMVIQCLNKSFIMVHNFADHDTEIHDWLNRLRMEMTPLRAGVNVRVGLSF